MLQSLAFPISYDMLSRSLAAVPRRGHGPALEPEDPILRAWLRPRRSEIEHAGARPPRLGATDGIRAERLDACRSDRHLGRSFNVELEKRGAAGFRFASRGGGARKPRPSRTRNTRAAGRCRQPGLDEPESWAFSSGAACSTEFRK